MIFLQGIFDQLSWPFAALFWRPKDKVVRTYGYLPMSGPEVIAGAYFLGLRANQEIR